MGSQYLLSADATSSGQLADETEQDRNDLADVADSLVDLVGEPARVQVLFQSPPQPALSPFDGVRWFWAARADHG